VCVIRIPYVRLACDDLWYQPLDGAVMSKVLAIPTNKAPDYFIGHKFTCGECEWKFAIDRVDIDTKLVHGKHQGQYYTWDYKIDCPNPDCRNVIFFDTFSNPIYKQLAAIIVGITLGLLITWGVHALL
jgi:hypothetical protein